CLEMPGPIDQLSGIYCGAGLGEEARLCVLIHQGEPGTRAEADESTAKWIRALIERLGSAAETRKAGAVWFGDGRDIIAATRSQRDAQQFTSTVLYRSHEGRSALEPQRPEFPIAV